MMIKDIPDRYKKRVLVFGCGNILFGDDGFGPEIIEYLRKYYSIPSNTGTINAGCSIRNILFDLILSEEKPEKLIIIDAIDANLRPGEIFEVELDEIPENKLDDFSMHQVPSSNLLREIRDYCKIKITILACQVQKIPEQVAPGLSKPVQKAVPKMCSNILEILRTET